MVAKKGPKNQVLSQDDGIVIMSFTPRMSYFEALQLAVRLIMVAGPLSGLHMNCLKKILEGDEKFYASI